MPIALSTDDYEVVDPRNEEIMVLGNELKGYPGKDIFFSKRFFNEQQIDNMFLRHKFFRTNISPINIKLSNK